MKKIFIAEDENITALFIEKTLQKNNYIVCGKTNKGDDAVDLIKSTKPDIILLDLKLKTKVSGIDVLNQMIEEDINIPVILTTGNSDSSTFSCLKEKGVTHFLFKPFSQEELISKIKEILN